MSQAIGPPSSQGSSSSAHLFTGTADPTIPANKFNSASKTEQTRGADELMLISDEGVRIKLKKSTFVGRARQEGVVKTLSVVLSNLPIELVPVIAAYVEPPSSKILVSSEDVLVLSATADSVKALQQYVEGRHDCDLDGWVYSVAADRQTLYDLLFLSTLFSVPLLEQACYRAIVNIIAGVPLKALSSWMAPILDREFKLATASSALDMQLPQEEMKLYPCSQSAQLKKFVGQDEVALVNFEVPRVCDKPFLFLIDLDATLICLEATPSMGPATFQVPRIHPDAREHIEAGDLFIHSDGTRCIFRPGLKQFAQRLRQFNDFDICIVTQNSSRYLPAVLDLLEGLFGSHLPCVSLPRGSRKHIAPFLQVAPSTCAIVFDDNYDAWHPFWDRRSTSALSHTANTISTGSSASCSTSTTFSDASTQGSLQGNVRRYPMASPPAFASIFVQVPALSTDYRPRLLSDVRVAIDYIDALPISLARASRDFLTRERVRRHVVPLLPPQISEAINRLEAVFVSRFLPSAASRIDYCKGCQSVVRVADSEDGATCLSPSCQKSDVGGCSVIAHDRKGEGRLGEGHRGYEGDEDRALPLRRLRRARREG